ncbi:ferrous iron transport protein A [Thermodesulfovibrionales bacterium]|nr:ferrous iron transport protein A [Thermodesulfovibrionales bacterium]MCL0036904.1 ferrous iron transport protein A [Thermodesulfovibrionales bacterium]MCL0040227.1 ferrous iron transport protein A [Thermodesulfovibrionales bacterium]MCL0046681.1 ferrous iron transport protein A [Thermodesulfovibrionales bacterium]MCL0051189.1 ferrous iron transport protein A [Thermodesulfovibrionales bacterium]
MVTNLCKLAEGEVATIRHIECEHKIQRRLAVLGIKTGKTVRKITSAPLRGPLVIAVDRAKVAVGRGMAERVFIEVEG